MFTFNVVARVVGMNVRIDCICVFSSIVEINRLASVHVD